MCNLAHYALSLITSERLLPYPLCCILSLKCVNLPTMHYDNTGEQPTESGKYSRYSGEQSREQGSRAEIQGAEQGYRGAEQRY